MASKFDITIRSETSLTHNVLQNLGRPCFIAFAPYWATSYAPSTLQLTRPLQGSTFFTLSVRCVSFSNVTAMLSFILYEMSLTNNAATTARAEKDTAA